MARLLSVGVLLLSLILPLLASPGPSKRVVHERRTDILRKRFIPHRRAENDMLIPLRIALKQQNADRVEEILNEIAHPESPKYGQHYSPAEVAKMFAPTKDTVDTVMDWLSEHGITADRVITSASGGWLNVKVAVHEAETLLDTTYHLYKHQDGSQHLGPLELVIL
jgi:tripeptidyl-peptidase I